MVKKTLKKINVPLNIAEKQAQYVISQIESLHRKFCLGKINNNEYINKCNQITDKFVKNFGYWHSETESYKKFYKSFGN